MKTLTGRSRGLLGLDRRGNPGGFGKPRPIHTDLLKRKVGNIFEIARLIESLIAAMLDELIVTTHAA